MSSAVNNWDLSECDDVATQRREPEITESDPAFESGTRAVPSFASVDAHIALWDALGDVYRQLGRIPEARAAYEQGQQREGRGAEVVVRLAQLK